MTVDNLANAPLVELGVIVLWHPLEQDKLTALVLETEYRKRLREQFDYEIERHQEPVGESVGPDPLLSFHLEEPNSTVEIRLGLGGISITTSQPYQNWRSFRPVVETALSVLIDVTDSFGGAIFEASTIRYVDAFGPEYWPDNDFKRFVSEVLGFGITMPERVSVLQPTKDNYLNFFTFERKVTEHQTIRIDSGKAMFNGEDGIVLDIRVTSEFSGEGTVTSLGEVLASLDGSQKISHQFFEEVTEPVISIMENKGEE